MQLLSLLLLKLDLPFLLKLISRLQYHLKQSHGFFLGLLLSPTVSPLKKAVCRKVATALVGMI